MKPWRRGWPLRSVATLIAMSLFYYVVLAILESFHQIHDDHAVYNTVVNSQLDGLSSLASLNLRINASRTFKYRHLKSSESSSPREQGRGVKSIVRSRNLNSGISKLNNTETEKNTSSPYLGCRDITEIQVLGKVGRGYTKTVQNGQYQGMEVALKSVQPDNEDISECVKSPMVRRSVDECFIFAKYKLAKEIIMLQQLQHANIVKVRYQPY